MTPMRDAITFSTSMILERPETIRRIDAELLEVLR